MVTSIEVVEVTLKSGTKTQVYVQEMCKTYKTNANIQTFGSYPTKPVGIVGNRIRY